MKVAKKMTKADEKRLEARVLEVHKRYNTVEGRSIKSIMGDNGLTHHALPVEYMDGKIRLLDINPSKVAYIGAILEEGSYYKFEIAFDSFTSDALVHVIYNKKDKYALDRIDQDRSWLVSAMVNCYQAGWDRPKMNTPKKRKEIK